MIRCNINQHLYLQEIDETTTSLIFHAIDTNRNHLRTWLPFVDSTHSESDSQLFVNSVLNSEPKEYVFGIFHQHHFVGLIGTVKSDLKNRKTEIGYWLIESAQGQGIVHQCAKVVIHFLFEKLNFNRIQIKVAVNNLKSKNVAEKLPLHCEGIERDGELLSNGFTDLYVYSVLKNDFFTSND